jgi:hypothetical protein
MRFLSQSLVLVSLVQMTLGASISHAALEDSTFSANLFSVRTFVDGNKENTVDGLFDPKPNMGGGITITPVDPSRPADPNNGPVPGKPAPTPSNPNGLPGVTPGTGTTVTPAPSTGAGKITMGKTTFQCNLFENSEYTDLISAVNVLNQAINTPSCGGSDVNVKGIQDNNAAILNALKAIHAVLGMDAPTQDGSPAPAPGTVTFPDSFDVSKDNAKVNTVITNVDAAIQAAAGIAKAFASNDLLKQECRDQMGSGDVAVALSNIINGLTPYALMASSLTGGTAAVPWIVGGTVLTSTVSSIGKIVAANSINVKDAATRRAIVENTCQFIRMDQKYKFLIQNRKEQTTRISNEIKASKLLFQTSISNLDPAVAKLVDRKAQLDQAAQKLNAQIDPAQSLLNSDKQFVTITSDDIKICQLGIQLAVTNTDANSYVNQLLSSIDVATQAYGSANLPQARALKLSSDYAMSSLLKIAQQPFTTSANFEGCAKLTKSLIETMEQTGTLAKRLVATAQRSVNSELMKNRDYGMIQSQMRLLEQKQNLAQNVTNSLENLRSYATSFTQSEINAEMDRLRSGLFGSRGFMQGSPVMAWFDYTKQLHSTAVTQFKRGLTTLRLRAYSFTDEAKNGRNAAYALANGPIVSVDQKAAYQLLPFNKTNMPVGSTAHTDACRELNDVWTRWVVAIDHLSAIESLCGMINPYIYDNRTEDRALVVMCRGVQANTPGGFATASTLQTLKNTLLGDKSRDWSLYVRSTLQNLSCPALQQDY